MRQLPAAPSHRRTRVARVGMLVLALALAAACDEDDDADNDPFPGCPGQERVPAFCGVEPEEQCTGNLCQLWEDGQVLCMQALLQCAATCRDDGSDWDTCACATGRPRPECTAACETMRCNEACDAKSVLSCQQRCQDFFDQHEARRGAPPSEACAVTIATIAVCMPDRGCQQAPPCEGAADWDTQRDLYLADCALE